MQEEKFLKAGEAATFLHVTNIKKPANHAGFIYDEFVNYKYLIMNVCSI